MRRGPIYLNRPEARRFFLRNGYVYTLRSKRGTGPTKARVGSRFRFRSLGSVSVGLVWSRPSSLVLRRFLRRSGFDNVRAWREAAGPKQRTLYIVLRWPLISSIDIVGWST